MNKKIKILSLIIAMVYLLSACGQVANTEINDAIQQEENEQSAVQDEQSNEQNDKTDLNQDKIKVVAAFYPVYDLVQRVGGDRVEVINLTKSGSAHGFEPSIEDMKNIVDADMFAINGAGFESYIDGIRTNNPDLNIVDLSQGIDLLSSDGHDHDHDDHGHEEDSHDGHSHGPNDPHIWLSLDNAVKMMETIKDELSKLDSENQELFNKNYDENKVKFENLDSDFESKFEAYKGKSFVVPHEAFAYLTEEFGLKQVGIEGINSDSEPNIQRMAEIVDIMNKEQTKTVFYEYGKSDKVASTIAAEIGGNIKPISTLEVLNEQDLESGKDYLSLMEMNLQNILDSFEGK